MNLSRSRTLERRGFRIDRHCTNVMKPVFYHIEFFGAEMLGCCLNAVKVLGYDLFYYFSFSA